MQNLVVWTGPVAPFHVTGATVPDAKEIFIQCCGDLTPPCQPPTCSTIGSSVMGSPDALLARAHMSRDQLSDLFLAGFSAGGSILKRVLTNPEYRKVTTAVHGADATYTASWVGNPANRNPPAIEGYVQYAVDVAQGPGDKLLVLTASPVPNKNWATGVENLGAIRREVERRTGRQFVKRSNFFNIDPGPAHTYQLGNVLLAEYPMNPLGHGHTTIASQVWQKIIQPWLAKGKGPVDLPGPVQPGNGNGDGKPPVTPPTVPRPRTEIGLTEALIGIGTVAAGYLVARSLWASAAERGRVGANGTRDRGRAR